MKKSSRSSSSKATFISERSERNTKPLLIFVLFVVMLLSAVYLYFKNGSSEKKTEVAEAPQNTITQEQTTQPQTLLDKVKKHLIVSETDIPYIATITNIDLVKEKNPDFYANASDGDKVIVWKDRAVIYSEQKDLIVAVATAKPLLAASVPDQNMGEGTATSTPSDLITQQVASTTIEVRNGSRKNGAAKVLKTQLEALGLHIEKVGDAGAVYQGNQIIDLTQGKVPTVMDLIMKSTSGTALTVLPDGEKPTNAQVLIIIGK